MICALYIYRQEDDLPVGYRCYASEASLRHCFPVGHDGCILRRIIELEADQGRINLSSTLSRLAFIVAVVNTLVGVCIVYKQHQSHSSALRVEYIFAFDTEIKA